MPQKHNETENVADSPQIFAKVVTAAAVAVTGDPNEFEKIAHSVRDPAVHRSTHCRPSACCQLPDDPHAVCRTGVLCPHIS